jgi:periplasmic protein TonB
MEEEGKNKRNGLIATITIHVLLVLLFIFYGLTQLIPPPEDGIAINFGYEEDGSGNTSQASPEQPSQTSQQVPQETAEQIDNDVVTQEMVEAPSVDKEKTTPKEKPAEKPVENKVQTPQPSSDLNRIINRTKSGQGEGEGITEGGGDQGDPNGDPNSPNREGNGGTGNSGDYQLKGRKALERPKPKYDCPDEGRVVVKVYVDRSGKVINAIPGEKIPAGPGSTTTSSCLYQPSLREAAMKTIVAEATTQHLTFRLVSSSTISPRNRRPCFPISKRWIGCMPSCPCTSARAVQTTRLI